MKDKGKKEQRRVYVVGMKRETGSRQSEDEK